MKKLPFLLTLCALELIRGEHIPWKSMTDFETQVVEYMSPRFPLHTEGNSFATETYPSDTCGVSASNPCENHAREHACMITANPAKATISFLRWGARFKEDGLPQLFTRTTAKCAPCAWWQDGCVPLMASSKRTRCSLENQQVEVVGGLTYESECLNEWITNTLPESEALRNWGSNSNDEICYADNFWSYLGIALSGRTDDCLARMAVKAAMYLGCQHTMREVAMRIPRGKLCAPLSRFVPSSAVPCGHEEISRRPWSAKGHVPEAAVPAGALNEGKPSRENPV